MIKVAFITTDFSEEYGLRGVGFYSQRLVEAFEKIKSKKFLIKVLSFKNFKKLPFKELKNYDVIHYSFFDPFFLTLPFFKFKPTIVTVHDLIPLKFPQKFPKGIKGWFKWQIQKISLKQSKAIITDSFNSKKDILEIIKIEAKKISPIYLAAGEEFKPLTTERTLQVSKKYNLPKKFILYVGDLNWNKNVLGLIAGFKKISLDFKDIYLVMVGKAFLNKNLVERKEMMKLIEKLNLREKIKFLGFIPTFDLVAVYNRALGYCQPSFYEGFGLPVLEAMACGCPVVCSEKSSLKEIGDRAVVFIDPFKTESLIWGLKELLSNKILREKLKRKGLEWVKNFSWEKTAQKTLKVYQKIYNGCKSKGNFRSQIEIDKI